MEVFVGCQVEKVLLSLPLCRGPSRSSEMQVSSLFDTLDGTEGMSKVRYLRGWMGVMVLAVDVVVVVLTLGGWKMVIGWDAIKTVGQIRRFQCKPLLSKRTSSTSTVHQKARPPTVSYLSSL